MSAKHLLGRLSALALALSVAPVALAGPDWVEVGDAGSTVGSAQVPLRPTGVTFLSSIQGSLASGVGVSDYEDLYLIRITDPVAFSITPATADFNPVFYLFNLTLANEALGLLANDDQSEENNFPLLTQFSTDGTMVQVANPGDYILAVTGSGRTPISRAGQIFSFEDPTEISGPDGPGGLNPLMAWVGEGQTGDYRIDFEEVDFPQTPTPGAAGALIMGGLLVNRRRR